MSPPDNCKNTMICQKSALAKVHGHRDDSFYRVDNEHRESLNGTYYLMRPTSWLIRETVLDNNRLSA